MTKFDFGSLKKREKAVRTSIVPLYVSLNVRPVPHPVGDCICEGHIHRFIALRTSSISARSLRDGTLK